MKRRLFVAISAMFALGMSAQTTIVTAPPLAPNNGSSAVTWEMTTTAPVIVTGISNIFNAGTITCEVWYRPGGVLAVGQTSPTVDVANGWILAGTATGFNSASATAPTAIPIANLSIPVNAGTPVGFALNASTGGTRYMTHVAANQVDFTASGTTVKTGPGFGFGGTITSWNANRQFLGSVTFVPVGPCINPPFVGNAISNKTITCPSESFTLSLDTATFGTGQSYQWQRSTDSLTWTNMVNDTTASINAIQSTTHYYRVIVTCTQSTTSGVVKVTTTALPLPGGTYTINNANPTAGSNFNSFEDFANEVNCGGISGAITLNVTNNPTPYSEQAIFESIIGSSSTNTITINGNGATLVSAGGLDDRATLTMSATQYVTINNLKIENTATANGYGVELRNDARYITFDNCEIKVPLAAIATSSAAFVMSNAPTGATTAGLAARDITITNCLIEGGYYGLVVNGPTSAPWSSNNTIENNTIRDFYLYGLFVRGQENSTFKKNDITRAVRNTLSTFYGIYVNSGLEGVRFEANSIHNIADGLPSNTSSAYPIYGTGAIATSANPCVFANNVVYNINSNGIQYGIYILSGDHLRFYHNTVSLDNQQAVNTSAIRAAFVSATSGTFEFKNNIFNVTHSGTGTKYGFYQTSANAAITINYNQYFLNSGGTANHVGFYPSSSFTTLANWQTANSNAYEANGVYGDPVFTNSLAGNMVPLSGTGNNVGENLTSVVPTDFNGATRSTTPDIGGLEYTPITDDISLVSGELTRGKCLTTNDTVNLVVQNVVGGTVNFVNDPLTATWSVSGPVNSNGTITVNTGTLAPTATLTLSAFTVNMSIPGVYTLEAYIAPNPMNLSAANDTLMSVQFMVNDNFTATPKFDTVFNTTDSVEINLMSPFLPGGSVFMTEICHFKTGTGAPAGGWPTYLIADDYIEITGVPNSDLAGYTLEQWSTTALISSNTFATGTVFSPQGTMVVAVGQLGTSQPSPSDYYYHDGNTTTFGSTTAAGRIIKDPNGNIVDAVGYGTYTFPAAANVTPSDWSGNTPAVSSSGNRLEGAYTKDASNWINSGTSPQDPNTVNNNVTVPSPVAITGFTWTLNGVVVDTVPNTFVGPWSAAGTYQYVATYNTPCGILTDTVTIIVDIPSPCDMPSSVSDANTTCESTEISWTSDLNMLSSKIEFGATGFTPGSGTMISGATSPQVIAGLMPGMGYDVYITDSCAAGESFPAMASVTTPSTPMPVISANITQIATTATDATVEFDATASANFTTIDWDFGDGNSGSGANVTHVYISNQTYIVVATATGPCGIETETFQVSVNGISVSEIELARSLKVYPNPTTGALRVEFSSKQNDAVTFRILSIGGQLVAQSEALVSAGQHREDFELSRYPAGVYFVQITTNQGVVTRRIVLQP